MVSELWRFESISNRLHAAIDGGAALAAGARCVNALWTHRWRAIPRGVSSQLTILLSLRLRQRSPSGDSSCTQSVVISPDAVTFASPAGVGLFCDAP